MGSVVSSGKLILLNAEEIQLINATHDNMENNFINIYHKIQHFDNEVRYTPENLKQYSHDELKMRTHLFLGIIYAELQLIKYEYEKLKDRISWFKNEFSSTGLHNLNEELDDSPVGILSMIPFPQEPEPEKKTPI